MRRPLEQQRPEPAQEHPIRRPGPRLSHAFAGKGPLLQNGHRSACLFARGEREKRCTEQAAPFAVATGGYQGEFTLGRCNITEGPAHLWALTTASVEGCLAWPREAASNRISTESVVSHEMKKNNTNTEMAMPQRIT